MSYTLEVLPGDPIIWDTWGADLNPEIDTEPLNHEVLRILNAASGPMVLVVDTREVDLGWNEILYLSNNATPQEITNHPRLRKIILITSDEVVAASAKGMDSQAFGFVKLDLVASANEALAHARQALS